MLQTLGSHNGLVHLHSPNPHSRGFLRKLCAKDIGKQCDKGVFVLRLPCLSACFSVSSVPRPDPPKQVRGPDKQSLSEEVFRQKYHTCEHKHNSLKAVELLGKQTVWWIEVKRAGNW